MVGRFTLRVQHSSYLGRFVFDVFYGVIEEMTRSRSILPTLSTIIVCLCYSINNSASAFCVDNSCASHQVGDWNGRHLYTAHSSPLAPLTASSGIESLDTCNSRTGRLPPVLQDMINERREYELKLGKAMDTLQTDYPQLLIKTPDFNIYHEEISVIDPSGLQLSGLNSYKSSFKILQSVIGLFYNTDKSSVQFRMIYDFSRSSIRISFNVILIPKVVGNRRNALYVDGISVYKMSSQGKITEHRIENLMMNNIPVRPPYGVLSELLKPISSLQGSPVGVPAGGFGIGSNTI